MIHDKVWRGEAKVTIVDIEGVLRINSKVFMPKVRD